jgi:uncharacterized protein (TIGR03067 family)
MQDKPDPTREDRDKLRGSWELVAIEENGKRHEVTKESERYLTLSFLTDYVTLESKDKKNEARYKLDATQTPRCIDITSADGADKDKPYLGIYEVSDESLKLCLANKEPDQEPRPAKFQAMGRVVVMTFKKVKR